MKKSIKIIAFSLVSVFILSSCAVDEYGNPRSLTNAEKGALIGATTGALIGYKKDGKKKAILYGLVGGLAGGAVGSYMDSQRKDFEKQLASEIQAGAVEVNKLPENNLLVTMTSQTAFSVDSASIKSGFNPTLDKISYIVNKYGKTHLNIVGHTDSTGSRAYNQKLSENRARSIESYFGNKQVIPQRMSIYGMGEDQPRADNKTEAGRRLNRRVEIVIEPIVAQ